MKQTLKLTMLLFAAMFVILQACNNGEKKDSGKVDVKDTNAVVNSPTNPPENNTPDNNTQPNTPPHLNLALTKLIPSFHMNGDPGSDDGKDWDTRVYLKVIYQGRDIASFQYGGCCSSGRPAEGRGTYDDWISGQDIPDATKKHTLPPLVINEAVTKEMLSNSEYYIGFQSSHRGAGNDRIHFNAKLIAEFSDGTSQQWSWNNQDIKCDDENVIVDVKLSLKGQ